MVSNGIRPPTHAGWIQMQQSICSKIQVEVVLPFSDKARISAEREYIS
jgi:hypothetical protein